jgi:hypothetical protein
MRIEKLPFLEQVKLAEKKNMAKKRVARKRNTYDVSPEKFCTEYNKAQKAGKSIADLAKTLEMPAQAIIARRNSYKALGVKFKPLKRASRSKIDAKALQALLDK